ncbi:peptidoglycan DD-metalloendopeptidase family protein [bacterium]|nr:MAG: peptidoglycan DD-metalloendopeptidase family protein [bacterium]
MSSLKWYLQGILNSYSQVFFSDNKVFASILLLVTFVDFYTGLFGLFSVLISNATALWIGFDKFRIRQGYYGFNSLLVGLGLGVYFQPGILLLLLVLLAAVLTLFFSVALEGIIGKYGLPYLSVPFVLSLWALTLASREFQALGLNERQIYTLNDLYTIGGSLFVDLYEWWNSIPIPVSLKGYFLSLGAILFQHSVFAGVLVAIGLLVYSRIGFILSLIGFYIAYLFYLLIGARFTEVGYSYIGFNYILSAIAIGGYFIIPNRNSYLAVILLIPMVAILTISLSSVLALYHLPIYSLPFNIVTLLFLYALKFRVHNNAKLNTLFIQQNSPEKNLYSFINHTERFGKESPVSIFLPFFGEWVITQGHNGEYTHKNGWRHAWDFEMADDAGKTYKNEGDYTEDYYCYNKNIIAPADGTIEEVVDDIQDNMIGEKNLENNWGNTIIIKHAEYLYTKLSHLKQGTVQVTSGDKVKKGDLLGKCGNSGNSPYPHLHFQVQATPYIGSKTIDYPISNYFLKTSKNVELKTVATPEKNQTISNIQVNPSLRRAFFFIPGEKIKFNVIDSAEHEADWEVKIDYFLNKYIECEKSKSKAYFKIDDAMMHFIHFEGDRRSLLYYFYLAAYKVCLGFNKEFVLHDAYPLNMVFNPKNLVLQDFVAPFFRYKSGEFSLTYAGSHDALSDTRLVLNSKTTTKVFGKKSKEISFFFYVDKRGIKEFEIQTNQINIRAICIND